MTLPSDALSQLQSALAPLKSAVTWAVRQASGSYATASALDVVITDDVTTQEFDAEANERVSVRRLTVQPLATAAAVLGDRLTYAAVNFHISAISQLDVPTWVCEYRTSLGGQRRDHFRAAGGGA